MKQRWLYLLLLGLTGICFLLSALEINTRYIKNTFDDDYDSYVQPDNSSVYHAVVSVPQIDLPPLLSTPGFTVNFLTLNEFAEKQSANISPLLLVNPPDIFLFNRIFRI